MGLITLAVLQTGWSFFRGEEAPQASAIPAVANQSSPPSPEEQGRASGEQAGPRGKEAGRFDPTMNPLLRALRPANFVAKLAADGTDWRFKPIDELRLPEDGKPLTVYVLMYAQLDPATEETWRQAGMFENEASDFRRPFLRRITLTSQACLDNLFDWHVEGYDACAPHDPKPPPQPAAEPVEEDQ